MAKAQTKSAYNKEKKKKATALGKKRMKDEGVEDTVKKSKSKKLFSPNTHGLMPCGECFEMCAVRTLECSNARCTHCGGKSKRTSDLRKENNVK